MAKRQPTKPLPGGGICRRRFLRKLRSKTKELLLMLPIFPLAFTSRRASEYFRFAIFLNVWVLIIGLACAAVAYRLITLSQSAPPGAFTATLTVALVSMCGFVMVVVVGSFVIGLIDRGLKLRRQRFVPNAIVADLFLQVLSKTEKQQHQWNDVNFKREIIRRLAEIAACVEADYSMSLRTGDAGTDGWQRQTAEQIGAGVRNLIMWVYTPKADTRAQFINRVTSYFICAVSGDWDGFERAQPQVVSRPELLRSRLRSAVTAVASAIIPLVVLVVVQRLKLIEGVVLSYLTVGAFIWTGLSLLSHVDPSYGSKLTAIKEISSFLPLPRRGRE